MQYIAGLLGIKRNIAIIRGPNGHSAVIERTKGINEILSKYPYSKVVFDQYGNWNPVHGMTLIKNWLQSGKWIDAVVSQNDEMVLGAYKAIETAKNKMIFLLSV